jgi:hypothetical protein
VPSLIPTHKALLKLGLRTLVYSGDHDMAVRCCSWPQGVSTLPILYLYERICAQWHNNRCNTADLLSRNSFWQLARPCKMHP